ncbi:MAG: hypothetical protein AAGA02_09825, partial [Bacteroidota bacterium]
GSSASVFSYGENAFIWDSEAVTMTRWSIDKSSLELSVDAILSLASTGVGGGRSNPTFISESQAFLSRLEEGVIVEFNPTLMEITKTHSVAPLDEGENMDGWVSEYIGYPVNGKIFYPIYKSTPNTCCEFYQNIRATVAVFDPSSSSIEYVHDDRLMGSRSDFLVDEKGNMYVTPSYTNSFIEPYFDLDPSMTSKPWGILKFNADGSFDPDFFVDLSESVDMSFNHNSMLAHSDHIVINYIDKTYSHPESFDDRFDVFGRTDFRSGSVNLATGELESFESLNKSSGTYYLNTIDGLNYYQIFDKDHETRNLLYRQNSLTDYTTVSSNETGRINYIGKLW